MPLQKLGLIGKTLTYSFSKQYFADKFENQKIDGFVYDLYPLETIEAVKPILQDPNFRGINVTIPYKQEVMAFLDELEPSAQKIGAVNTIKIENGIKKGYNTDAYGFRVSLEQLLDGELPSNALILGTGGASKAIAYVLEEMGIEYKFVSRSPKAQNLSYEQVTESILEKYKLLINCTPLGTSPNITEKPTLPYNFLTETHFLYDLVYNPSTTAFMKEGLAAGAKVTNGYRMLELQADKAWEIWTEKD